MFFDFNLGLLDRVIRLLCRCHTLRGGWCIGIYIPPRSLANRLMRLLPTVSGFRLFLPVVQFTNLTPDVLNLQYLLNDHLKSLALIPRHNLTIHQHILLHRLEVRELKQQARQVSIVGNAYL